MKLNALAISGLLMMTITSFAAAQTTQKHKKKIHEDEKGNVFVNRSLPVYLSIATSPDGENSKVLKGQDPMYSYPMYLDTEGYNSIRSPWKVNPETKETIYPKQEVIFELYADGTAPEISHEFTAENTVIEDNLWLINEKEVTLSAKDELSGVDKLYYLINNAAYSIYTQPLSLNEEKPYLIKYYAVDLVGNVSEVAELKVQPDFTSPNTAVTVAGDQSEEHVSTRSTLVLSAKDSISGIAKTFYQLDDGNTFHYKQPIKLDDMAEGEHTITYFSVDRVENIEEKKSFSFYVDKSAPKVISEVIGNTFFANGREYYSGKTKLKLVAMDNKSGVKDLLYSINGGEFKEYDQPFYLKQAGALDIQVMAIDKVNNRERTQEFSNNSNARVYVDLSGPNLDFELEGPSFEIQDTLYLNVQSKIKLIGRDSESGFKEIDYQLNGGVIQTYAGPFSVEKEGFYTITYNGYDNLQNSNTSTISVQVDNSGPEIFHRFSITSNKNKLVDGEELPVFPAHTVLFLSATDKYSGLDKISYQLNEGSKQPYRSLIENFKQGTVYSITAYVQDKLGNENSEEIKFYIE